MSTFGVEVDEEIYQEILDDLYDQAVPGTEEVESTDYPEDVNVPYLHWIPEDTMLDTVEQYCDEYGLGRGERRQVKRSVVLGVSPSTSLENVERARDEAGLKPLEYLLEEEPGVDAGEVL